MRAAGTFTVVTFDPTDVTPTPPVTTALPVGVSTMEKTYTGEVDGRSSTLFTAAFDHTTGAGTYVAMESFDGTLAGRRGTFNFAHSASTTGTNREGDFFVIVPASGTADLAGLSGTGGITITEDGTHHIWFDFDL
ncbi:hypothetical protein BLA60_31730 [Actinophytocola xinjiangensis]|uniref:DUF3224 domain-containing protein n=1 Tax=Actinophytocola xinjiangensis TaxID=485602 RepID=A0A7Z0WHC8_9PSEU|nr:DUF3224 domain-containing protein [Actinophytocola xinjiangensis]OLF06537.1 hypothetical protein BLA60_31730 [Actinophytocola xinjiangensis]